MRLPEDIGVKAALAIALAAAVGVALWLTAAPMTGQRLAEQCPWAHCEADIPLPQAVKFGH